jgi:hypothetical protein
LKVRGASLGTALSPGWMIVAPELYVLGAELGAQQLGA